MRSLNETIILGTPNVTYTAGPYDVGWILNGSFTVTISGSLGNAAYSLQIQSSNYQPPNGASIGSGWVVPSTSFSNVGGAQTLTGNGNINMTMTSQSVAGRYIQLVLTNTTQDTGAISVDVQFKDG